MNKRETEKARNAQGRILETLIGAFVLEKGGWIDRVWEGGNASYVLPTTLGPLYVHRVNDWIACRFFDVDRAKAVLPSGYTHRLNPFSGKWNWGCGDQHQADALFARWKAAVEHYLPATDLTTKAEFDAWYEASRAAAELPDPEPTVNPDGSKNPQTPA